VTRLVIDFAPQSHQSRNRSYHHAPGTRAFQGGDQRLPGLVEVLDHIEQPHRVVSAAQEWRGALGKIVHEEQTPRRPPRCLSHPIQMTIHSGHFVSEPRKVGADRAASATQLQHPIGRSASELQQPLGNEIIAGAKPEMARFGLGESAQCVLTHDAERSVIHRERGEHLQIVHRGFRRIVAPLRLERMRDSSLLCPTPAPPWAGERIRGTSKQD